MNIIGIVGIIASEKTWISKDCMKDFSACQSFYVFMLKAIWETKIVLLYVQALCTYTVILSS